MEIGTYPLEKTSIFQGADAQQVQKMLGVILPSIKTYARGETICRAGETVLSLGIVLAGGATIELCDAWGNRSIIERLEPGEGFAEAYACLPGEPLMVSVTADAPTRVMFLGVSRMLSMGLEPEHRRNSDLVNMKRKLSQEEETTISKWLGAGKEPVNGKC